VNLKELRALVRRVAADWKEPYLWPNEFVDMAINDAELEACRRARLIIDSSTAKICRIALAAQQPLYAIDNRVIFIRRVKRASDGLVLGVGRVRDLDGYAQGWEDETGEVVGWIPDHTTGKIRTYRTPTTDDLTDLNLTVVRGPLRPMKDADHCPEIHPRYHYNLHHWALHRLFSVQDTEGHDPVKAERAANAFGAEFGPPSPAIEEQWIDRNFDYNAEQGVY
jgi:hypothetical protein